MKAIDMWLRIVFFTGCTVAIAADFDSIRPLLESQCGACHSDKSKTSGFSIATMESVVRGGNKHGQAVVAGHPESSPLVKLLKGELQPAMPMGKPLPPESIAKVEAWVRSLTAEQAGVRKQEWRWPFEKPKRSPLPEVQHDAWVRTPIDRFILARLDRAGLRPASEASRRTLARRLYLDLVGVAPSLADLDAFLSDEAHGAYERLVEKLLSDPRYGERWGRHWLDLVRYGETSGLGRRRHRYGRRSRLGIQASTTTCLMTACHAPARRADEQARRATTTRSTCRATCPSASSAWRRGIALISSLKMFARIT
jgi:hypothetical protein